MTFLSSRALIASVAIGLLVGLFSLAGTGRQVLNHLQNDQQQNTNSVVTFESQLVKDENFMKLLDRHYSFGSMKIQRNLRSIKKLYVDKHASGDKEFKTVQEAVNAVMDGNNERVIIHVKEGTYKEKVHVPFNKSYITLEGAGMHKSIIEWDDNEERTLSTATTASVTLDADYFIARNISFKNTAPRPDPDLEFGGQASALRVSGDAAAFYGCGIYGYQDTLNDDRGRHLFRECHIEGAVDFIFGNARSLYERCTIKSVAKQAGSITAQSRSNQTHFTGFGFVHCNIIGTGQIVLGRAWRPYARVVIASTHMDDIINSARWDDWGMSDVDETVYFGEHENSGPGAIMSGRVSFARTLSSDDAAKFTRLNWINGSEWLE